MFKYKYFAVALFFVLLVSQLVLVAVEPVNANHDTCDDISAQVYTRCKDTRREAGQRRCYENNAGNNNAIATCVQGVTEHFDFTGSGSAPPLPDGALPVGTTNSSASQVIENADCTAEVDLNPGNCKIIDYLNKFINILSVMVGIVVTIMIIVGGIQYSAAGADPGAVAKAKKHISQAILALVGYGLIFAFLQYIIPGGLI